MAVFYQGAEFTPLYNQPQPRPGWTRSQRTCFHRIKTGLAVHAGERLRFLTLTTASGMRVPLMEAWNRLVLEIRRTWKRFDYHAIRTREGVTGVLHVLFFGRYIPALWIKLTWKFITGAAHDIDIRACRRDITKDGRGTMGLARYCITQYATGQDEYVRYSSSATWSFDRVATRWQYWKTCHSTLEDAIWAWDSCIQAGRIPGLPDELSWQTKLDVG